MYCAGSIAGNAFGGHLFPEDSARLTSGPFKEGTRRYVGGIAASVNQKLFDTLVHQQGEAVIVELEPHSKSLKIRGDFKIDTSLTEAMSELDGRSGLLDLCRRIAARIRHITGFDRVMLYRFLEDESGSVIAEDRRSDLAPFLGLRFPASDIPVQARRLYLLNTLRLKPDVNAQRVAIIPAVNPLTGAPLDMSFCILRAMSPVHDEYLRNMGVASSLSISIIKEGRLWGLVACHHTQALLVPHPLRITCEVLARMFSFSIAAAEEEDQRSRLTAMREVIEHITTRLRQDRDIAASLTNQSAQIQSVMRAHGVAFCVGGKLSLFGLTPVSLQVEALLEWLKANQQEHVWTTERLTSEYPESRAFSNDVGGILSLRIAIGAPDFVIWFRPAIVKIIDWAGNPDKPVVLTADERISPRRSFQLWKQTVGDLSEPWDQTDRQFARSFRYVVAEAMLLQMNEEVSRLNTELSRSNIELDSFAYAASHDLQEPLRIIRAYTQLIVRGAGQSLAPPAREFLSIIENSADRMGHLINSLLNYSQLGGSERRERTIVSSEDALQAALMNLHEAVREAGAAITHDPLPLIKADHHHVVQLLQNLISNSIKYRRPDVPPCIHLSALLDRDCWRFSVRDNGQGFDPRYAELIFGAFKRLHGRDVPGNGIGLATCKRIVELNGGTLLGRKRGRGSRRNFLVHGPIPASRTIKEPNSKPGWRNRQTQRT